MAFDPSDKLIDFAASYFASIKEGKTPPLDPFTAGLIEDAIRYRAGLTNGAAPAPAPARAARPYAVGALQAKSVQAVLNAISEQPAGSGLRLPDIQKLAGTPKSTTERALQILAAAGKVAKDSHRAWYLTANGAPSGGTYELLRSAGFKHPGPVLTGMYDLFAADPEKVWTPAELKAALRLSPNSMGSVGRALHGLKDCKLVKKIGDAQYQLLKVATAS